MLENCPNTLPAAAENVPLGVPRVRTVLAVDAAVDAVELPK